MSTISTSLPKMQISTRAAKLNIRQKRPRFTIRHKRPKMQIRKKAPAFKIVRSASSAKTNNNAAVQISRRFTRNRISRDSNFTERIVSFMSDYNNDIRNNDDLSLDSSALEMIAKENTKSKVKPEDVSIEWEQGYFEIDWTEHVMEIEWDIDSSPEIYVEPYEIEIYVKTNISRNQKKKVSRMPSGTKVDKKI